MVSGGIWEIVRFRFSLGLGDRAPSISPARALALGMLSRRQMYGHQVLREAGPRERTEWAGTSPGSLYGVLSRLGDVGLIPAICTEQEGRRPARWHTELGEQLRHWRAGPG